MNISKMLNNSYKSYRTGRKEVAKEIFDKFDKYACIKNDKWYLDYKKEFS